jgi:DNA polymerase-1
VELLNKKPLVAHNAKPILRWALGNGVDLQSLVLDTAIASYIVNPARSDYDIESVAEDLLDSLPMRSENQQGEQGTLDFAGNWGTADRESVARAAYLCALIAAPIRSRLVEEKSSQLYSDIENPLVRVLARMEVLGVAVNKEQLTSINKRLTEETESFTAQLHKLAGRAFNLNSPTQLREILYEERGLTPGKKTKTGYSTDAATLEKLRPEWPEFIEPLLRYRELEKLRSTYGEGLIAVVDPADGRIHATFNQTVARTGRLSSEHPNLHNIPIRSDEGRIFRTAFVATNGAELLVADYNQIELRCIAHLADDPGLIEAFTAGVDVHTATAARVFGVKPDAVTSEQRSRAKMVAYGLAYGMEAYGLSQRLAIPVDEAAGILDSFFGAFPAIKSYMERTVADAKKMKYTETLFGRRRPIPELSSDNFRIRQAGERMAMNAAIQGLAADIFKIALVRIDDALTKQNLQARIVLQVHDEVLVEAPVNERETVENIVLDIMRSAAELRVPLEVNAAWGATWAEAK